MKAALCLNMIVRNESARILRSLNAALPYITTFAILDTGSTDDTIDIIKKWSVDNHIPGDIRRSTFENFSQARNEALTQARQWQRCVASPAFDYLLLQDADMELVVEDPDAFGQIAGGTAYEMVQKAGGIAYPNVRLLSIYDHTPIYVGVTHEYLAVVTTGCIAGAHFIDHADGANRVEKYERDIRLLSDDLKRDPTNARSWYYLGNSYRDAGNPRMAITAYEKRIALGGWDEEVWSAQTSLAACYRDMGDEAKFVLETLKAYQMRPQRAETLYDLASFFREQPNAQQIAMLFIEEGIKIPRPDDKLFVNDFVHSYGFKHEYSICAFYVPHKRERGFKLTNELALDKNAPEFTRRLARNNMFYYLPKLQDMAPSTKHTRITVPVKSHGFVEMNPSVCVRPSGLPRARLEAIVRTVNYRIDEHGRYMIGDTGCGDAPIVTENYLVQLDHAFNVTHSDKIVWPRPEPQFPLVVGLEDMRLFWHRGERNFVACVREQSLSGVCDQYHGKLDDENMTVTEWRRISDGVTHEKNWAPLPSPALRFMYRLDKMVDPNGVIDIPTRLAIENISGSSQWINWRGGFLAVVHEAIYNPAGKRCYQHRFAFYDYKLGQLVLSLPFVFQDKQIEFCAGLAECPMSDDLVLSYGVRDEEAWVTRVTSSDVGALVFGVH